MAKSKKFTDEYVSINGILQYFLHIQNVSKDVIIMLHGGPGIPNSYLAYYHQPYLDFCNVVYYDQRGAGKTQLKNKSKPESLSLDILLEDLKQTIRYLKHKYQTNRIFLAGHSWGTVLGTQYIIKYPQDIVGYIGYGQCVDMATSDRSWYKHLKRAVLKSGKRSHIKNINSVNAAYPQVNCEEFVKATLFLSRLESKYSYKANNFTKIYRKSPIMTFRAGMQIGGAEKFNQKLLKDVLHGYDIRSIKEYQVPIYYILGRYDEWTTSTVAAEYFNTIQAPNKKLYWIEEAGHATDTDNPSAFFKAIKEIIIQ